MGGEEFKNVVRLQQVRALPRVSERLTIGGFKSDGEQLMGLPWAGYVFAALPDFLRRTFLPGEARSPSATLPNGHYHSATLHWIVIISRISHTADSLLCYNKEKIGPSFFRIGGIRMSGNELDKEAFKAAKDTIQVLKGTVESLQLNLSQERDTNDGLQLTLESLKGDNERIQEENFQLQSELESLKEKEKKQSSNEESGKPFLSSVELAEKLRFYYQDMKKVDAKNLTVEDSETLYNILDYTFKALKKAGLKL